MNFQTMHKQRKFMMIAALVGAIAMFLPWIEVFIISVNGMHGAGIFIFLCFIACGIIAFMGDQTRPLDRMVWMIALILSAFAAVYMIISFFRVMGSGISVMGLGFYLALIAAIALAGATFAFRAAGYTIKNGFDSIRDGIGKSDMNKPRDPDSI